MRERWRVAEEECKPTSLSPTSKFLPSFASVLVFVREEPKIQKKKVEVTEKESRMANEKTRVVTRGVEERK
jgi:hypothetical protein